MKKVTRKVGLSYTTVLPKGDNSLFHKAKTSPNFQNFFGKPGIKGGFRRKVTRMNRTAIKGLRFSSYSLMIDFV